MNTPKTSYTGDSLTSYYRTPSTNKPALTRLQRKQNKSDGASNNSHTKSKKRRKKHHNAGNNIVMNFQHVLFSI